MEFSLILIASTHTLLPNPLIVKSEIPEILDRFSKVNVIVAYPLGFIVADSLLVCSIISGAILLLKFNTESAPALFVKCIRPSSPT